MSVIEGEGRVETLYGTYPRPQPPHDPLYLTRPDVIGRFGALVISHDQPGPSSTIKALARHIARQGFAVVVADPDDVPDAVEALEGAWAEWARGPISHLGIGDGGSAAVAAAEGDAPLLLLDVDLDHLDALGGSGPLLVVTTDADAPAKHEEIGRGVWAVYRDRVPGFWDDGSPDFSFADSIDVLERLVGFLERHLGVPAGV